MHIERIHEMMESLTKCAEAQLEKGVEQLDAEEFGKVTDMIKNLSEAEYYSSITKAMEESEYGEDYDYRGKKYYGGGRSRRYMDENRMYIDDDRERMYYDDYRYERTGRYAPKGRGTYEGRGGRRGYEEPPYYYQSDSENRMSVNDYRNGTYEKNRDMDRNSMGRMYYTEPTSNDTSRVEKARMEYEKNKDLDHLNKYVDSIKDDLLEMWSDMPSDQRTATKAKMTALIQKM